MAEIQPPEAQFNAAGTLILNTSDTLGSKRQRRPSVRLGDLGDDLPCDAHPRRTTKPWKLPSVAAPGKPSKTRPLTNLSITSDAAGEFVETLEADDGEGNDNNIGDGVAIGNWKVKEFKKRGSKRVRSNWASRIDEGSGGNGGEGEENYSGGNADDDDDDDGYREFDVENSESPLKEQSPINSMENLGVDGNRRSFKGMDHHHDGIELSWPSNTDCRDRNGNGGRVRYGVEDGVRIWLKGLGLGCYAPVFEIHEVDDEVLPMLTLEDLKDMGISAVGSRRKMYCAIQKLGKGSS